MWTLSRRFPPCVKTSEELLPLDQALQTNKNERFGFLGYTCTNLTHLHSTIQYHPYANVLWNRISLPAQRWQPMLTLSSPMRVTCHWIYLSTHHCFRAYIITHSVCIHLLQFSHCDSRYVGEREAMDRFESWKRFGTCGGHQYRSETWKPLRSVVEFHARCVYYFMLMQCWWV